MHPQIDQLPVQYRNLKYWYSLSDFYALNPPWQFRQQFKRWHTEYYPAYFGGERPVMVSLGRLVLILRYNVDKWLDAKSKRSKKPAWSAWAVMTRKYQQPAYDLDLNKWVTFKGVANHQPRDVYHDRNRSVIRTRKIYDQVFFYLDDVRYLERTVDLYRSREIIE